MPFSCPRKAIVSSAETVDAETHLLHSLQPVDQLLRQVFFRLGPQQPPSHPRILFHLRGKLNQLVYIAAHVPLRLGSKLDFFVQKGRVQTEINLNVARLFRGAFFKLHSRSEEHTSEL